MQDVVLIHYGELALKQGNRSWFEDHLIRNIRAVLADLGRISVRKLYGRILLRTLDEDVASDLVMKRLSGVFGIAWFGRAWMEELSWAGLLRATDRALPDQSGLTFGVRTKKAEQAWPRSRTETNRDLGAWVVENRGWGVDLTSPDLWVQVVIASDQVFVTTERHEGARGLPMGVSGRVLGLLSGGIDSPVAAWSMMSRGCDVTMLHFHSAPYTDRASQEKVFDLARALTPHQPEITLYNLAFADLQQEIVAKTPQQYRVILYRRFMMRIAEVVARQEKAGGLVTGESLGQVASQTLTNMATVESVTSLPVIRPLVGMDKEQITTMARRIGTYEISIQPHEDCCGFLMPRRPVTRSRPGELDKVETALDVEDLVGRALEKIETHRFSLCG